MCVDVIVIARVPRAQMTGNPMSFLKIVATTVVATKKIGRQTFREVAIELSGDQRPHACSVRRQTS